MTLYFTTGTVLVSLILTSTVMVLLWQGDKIIKAHTHSWQSTCTETLMQRQSRLGLKDIIIGAQPPLKCEEKQMARVAPCFGKASEQCHFKTPRVHTASRHPYWHRLNLKAMSQSLYRGSCSPLVLTLSASENLCLFPHQMQQSYLERKYDLRSDVSGWQRGGAD